jgi:folate-binding protein YgfZ
MTVSPTSNQFDKVTSLAEYEVFRLLNGLPESEELEGHIPLEYNLDLLNYISFTKGCYIGQELTARTKYRVISIPFPSLPPLSHPDLKGVVRKRVVPFIIADKANSFPKNSVPGFDFLSDDLVQETKRNMKTSPIIRPSLSSPIFRRSGGESVGVVVKMGQCT